MGTNTPLTRRMLVYKASPKVDFLFSFPYRFYSRDYMLIASLVMSVLRMVKLFGWEPRVAEIVKERREVELKWVWKGKVLRMVNNAIK